MERQIHPRIVAQFLKRSMQKKMSQTELAKRIGISKQQLTRMKEGSPDPRVLTSDMAQRIMLKLGYQAELIERVVSMLKDLEEKKVYRNSLNEMGMSTLEAICSTEHKDGKWYISVELWPRGEIEPRDIVVVKIDCELERVTYQYIINQKDMEDVSFTEAARSLVNSKDAVDIFMCKALEALAIKILWEQCDHLYTDIPERMQLLDGTSLKINALEKARKLFEADT